MLILGNLFGCHSIQTIPEPQECLIINEAPLRETPIPQCVGARTARDAGDCILQHRAAIRQCNSDKVNVK